MVSPHELRKKDFARTVRGYSTREVDDYVSYLIKNYIELYKANAELDKRVRALTAQNDELSKDTRAVRAALLDAQRAAEKIVGDAKEEARVIVSSAKRSCDSILNEFHVLVEKERAKLVITHNAVSEFKSRLFADYQAHIERIEEIDDEVEIPEIDEEELTERIITDMKANVASWAKTRDGGYDEQPVSPAAPDPVSFDAANKAEAEDMAEADEEEEKAAEEQPEIDDIPLDTELIADPPVEDSTATRTFDPVKDELPSAESAPEPEPEPEPAPEPEEYDDELAKLAAELAGENNK
ncbi:MAG: DivIVA domain-containing protein [Clostridia bacterium]|nr:DivIVA domain-containing protein [Clostridia bacterium]